MRDVLALRVPIAAMLAFAFVTAGVAPAAVLAQSAPSTAAQVPPEPSPTSAAATISGTVKTSGGAPIPGARVAIVGPVQSTVTTDATGAFSVTVPPGIYRVSVDKGGFLSASLRDIVVLAGESQPLAIALLQVDLSSLRTIGSVTVGRTGTSTINTGAAVTTYIPAQQFVELANPQINDVLQRAPDVTIQHMGSQADEEVIIGGSQPYETQVLIDGHPLALGQYGVWTSTYFPSFLVGGAEVQSGPGNTTPFANIAVGGTLNLLTPGFTEKNTAELTTGFDSYNSQNTNFLATGTVAKLGYVVGIGQASTNGPFQGKSGCVVSPDNFGAGDNKPGNAGIVQYCGSLAGPLFTNGDVLKLRYGFTPSTSLELGFVGAWAGFDPQGAAWGNSVGATTIEACQTANAFVCTGPQYQNLIGKTIDAYVEYPGSSVYNNQTLFDGQFRTSIGNNTLLIRPYIGAIEPEAIVGSEEGAYPAFFGPTPGSAAYTPPTVPNGQPIPGNLLTPANPGTALEQYCGVSNPFAFSQLNSPVNTSVVVKGQQECFQYPYSAFEQDKLYGTTFSFLHPFGDNLLNFTYDFHGQSVFAYFNGPTNISVPLSSNRYSTLSLTGYLHPIRNLGLNVGLYDTRWTVAGVQPQLDASGSPVINSFGVPNLVGLGRGVSRFDPHVALTFRPTSSVSYRASAGSSATFPFLGQVSGNASFQPFASSAPQYTAGVLTEKNPNLEPEVSIAYDLGVDKRLGGGSLLSLDLQDTDIHNVFETLVQNVAVGQGVEGVTAPINVARLRSELATLKYSYAPRFGLGFNVAVAAERSIVDGVPAAAYPTLASGSVGFPANGVQICGNGLVTPGIPTCIPYLKGYGQITYTNNDGTFAEIGVDYEGKNNSYFQPPFAQVDASFSTPLTKNVEFLLGVQNLLNTNSYEHLPAPGAGVPLVGDTQSGQSSYASTLIPAPPRTLHAQIRLHVGR